MTTTTPDGTEETSATSESGDVLATEQKQATPEENAGKLEKDYADLRLEYDRLKGQNDDMLKDIEGLKAATKTPEQPAKEVKETQPKNTEESPASTPNEQDERVDELLAREKLRSINSDLTDEQVNEVLATAKEKNIEVSDAHAMRVGRDYLSGSTSTGGEPQGETSIETDVDLTKLSKNELLDALEKEVS